MGCELPWLLDAPQRIVELEAELTTAYVRIAEEDAWVIAQIKQFEILLEHRGQPRPG